MTSTKWWLAAALLLATVLAPLSSAQAIHRRRVMYSGEPTGPWHGSYYHTMWGQPVALVVPPTAEYQTNLRWGVPSSRIERIDHQFSRNYPGPYAGGYGFLPTPVWPSDTNQFGVYYIRGPW